MLPYDTLARSCLTHKTVCWHVSDRVLCLALCQPADGAAEAVRAEPPRGLQVPVCASRLNSLEADQTLSSAPSGGRDKAVHQIVTVVAAVIMAALAHYT